MNPALYNAGYSSPSRIYERTHAHLGMTPARYGQGGRGASIRYSVVRCPLGFLLVAKTERGVCSVRLGSDRRALEQELIHEFPAARVARSDATFRPIVRALSAAWNGRPARDVPLDIQATAFQREVWEMLQRIPCGSTRSYSAVARALGRPGAARAVARACATNPVALVIPCHRVVRENGALGGYRWGLERKRALLERERGKVRTR